MKGAEKNTTQKCQKKKSWARGGTILLFKVILTTLTLTMTVILSPKPHSYMFYDLPIEPQLTTMVVSYGLGRAFSI